jgi:N-acetylmuramoyl-L-alanine amidase
MTRTPISAPAVLAAFLILSAASALPAWSQGEPPPAPAESPEERAQEESWGLIRTVVLDPGHGGEEVGAVGRSGIYEKDLALDIARRLRTRLESLKERTAVANHSAADLFLSIHLNSSRRASAHGTETYFLSLTASDEEAMNLARAENRGGAGGDAVPDDEAGGGGEPGETASSDLDLVLWGLAQSEHLARSSRLAELIQDEMNRLLGVQSRGVKQAPFTVLMGAIMPAVLVEVAFLSNKEEEELLATDGFRHQVVLALESSILKFRTESEQARAADLPGPRP